MPATQEGGTSLSRLVDCYKAVSEGVVVKVLISNGDKNTDERQYVSEVASAKPLPILGGVAGSQCCGESECFAPRTGFTDLRFRLTRECYFRRYP